MVRKFSFGLSKIGDTLDESVIMKEKITSKSVHDQLEAMRWLVTESHMHSDKDRLASHLTSQGLNSQHTQGTSPNGVDSWADTFLPSVVKLLATRHPEVKRLVCLFLVRHAEARPDDALMAVNEVQKGLSDANNPQTRALAVRVLSSIRVKDIIPITLVVIKNASLDPNPVVRKAAVIGLTKAYAFNRDLKDELVQTLEKVLEGEPAPSVLGSACAAYNVICPEKLELLHSPFRKLSKLLIDMDEWSQITTLGILHHYARANFINPNRAADADNANDLHLHSAEHENLSVSVDEFYDDGQEEKTNGQSPNVNREAMIVDDHKLLLRCTMPLLQSRNSAVILAAAAIQFDFAPSYDHNRTAKALMFAIRSSQSSCEYTLLANISSYVKKCPAVFAPYLDGFYVRASDAVHIKILKLNILTDIVSDEQLPSLLKELQSYLRDSNMTFVSEVICALGQCATKHIATQDRILKSLMTLSVHSSEEVSSHSVQVIMGIAQDNPAKYITQIAKLVKRYRMLTSSSAKAGVLWISSAHIVLKNSISCESMTDELEVRLNDLCYECTRVAALNFINEEDTVKIQILNNCAKLYVVNMKKIQKLHDYVFALAKVDTSYNVRDRCRFYAGLTKGEQISSINTTKSIILSSQKLERKQQNSFSPFALGSLSHVVNHSTPGYRPLPEFVLEPTGSHLRDPMWTANSNRTQTKVVTDSFDHPEPKQNANPSLAQSPLDNFYSDDDQASDGGSDSYSYYSSEVETETEAETEDLIIGNDDN